MAGKSAPKCAKCKDVGWIRDKQSDRVRHCQCQLDLRAESIIKRTIPEIYRKAPRLKNIPLCPDLRITVDFQKEILSILTNDPFDGYFLQGPTGTGKTYLMWALYKEALHAGRRARFTSCQLLTLKMRQNEFKRSFEEPDPDLVQIDDLRADFFGPYHLFIDEFGKEGQNKPQLATDQLFALIDHCYTNPSDVVLNVATNLTVDAFEEIYGEAMFRRIGEMCRFVKTTKGN